MAFKPKYEEVSLSFHYLVRGESAEEGATQIPFTQGEFDALHEELKKFLNLDVTDEEVGDKVRYRNLAPLLKIEQYNERYISGVFEGSYWGHSYKNSVRGEIPAQSINLRPFFFLLYLSDSGKIYLVSQYLGLFGGYTAIKNTVIKCLPKGHIASTSFNVGSSYYKGAVAKEVRITFSRKSDSIAGKNVFGQTGALVFKRQPNDDQFGKLVLENLLSKTTSKEVKKGAAQLLNGNDMLFGINDDDIQDCTVVALINKRSKVIPLIAAPNTATKFPIAVDLNPKGHPEYHAVKDEALKILDEIIARNEDV